MGAVTICLMIGGFLLTAKYGGSCKTAIWLGEAAFVAVTLIGLLQKLGYDPLGLLKGYVVGGLGIYPYVDHAREQQLAQRVLQCDVSLFHDAVSPGSGSREKRSHTAGRNVQYVGHDASAFTGK